MTETLVNITEMYGDVNNAEPPESKVNSIINDIISEISQSTKVVNIKDRKFPPTINKKIKHNQLKDNRIILQMYKTYSSDIEYAYGSVEKNVVNGKHTALLLIYDMYQAALKKRNIDLWDPDMDMVQQHADAIVDDVKVQLTSYINRRTSPSPKNTCLLVSKRSSVMLLLSAMYWRTPMILTKGTNPEINVVYIGAFVLKRLHETKSHKMKIANLMKVGERELCVSIDHMILTLDWLFAISAIQHNNDEVSINETAKTNN